MRWLIFSDLHGHRVAAEEISRYVAENSVDMMLFAGDLTHFGTRRDAGGLLDILTEPGVPMRAVIGNCDPPEIRDVLRNYNVDAGEQCISTKEGYSIIGITQTGSYRTQTKLPDSVLSSCHGKLVFLSHVPPAGCSVARVFTGQDAGSAYLRQLIEENTPVMCVCGHIHEGAGVDWIGRTLVVNPGPSRDGEMAVAEIEEEDIQIHTVRL